MSTTTFHNQHIPMESTTLDQLKDLVRINIDSRKGFEQAADTVDNKNLATLFRSIATRRQEHVNELRGLIDLADEEPPTDGTTLGTAQRWWLAARGAINGGDEKVILSAAERSEDVIKEHYEKALDATSGTRVQPLLLKQYDEVKREHDRVRDLRDAVKDA